jgi:hypothetical protein
MTQATTARAISSASSTWSCVRVKRGVMIVISSTDYTPRPLA